MRRISTLTVVAGLLAIVASGVPAGAQATPTLTVDPVAGAVGQMIAAKGEGFAAGLVEIHLDAVVFGEPLAEATVGRDGSFETEVAVPDTEPGGHRFIACREPGRDGTCREMADASFTVVSPTTTTSTTVPQRTTTTTTAPIRTTTTTTAPVRTTTTLPPRRTTTTAPVPTTAIITTTTSPATQASTTTLPPTPSASTTTTVTSSTTVPPIATIAPAEPGLATLTTTTAPAGGQLVADIPDGPDPTFDPTPDQIAAVTTTTIVDDFTFGGANDVDIELTHIEVTQGLQNLDNEFPLVEDRPTAVRVFGVMHGDTQSLASAFLQVSRGPDVIDVIEAENNPVLFTDSLVRISNDAAPYFLLDNSYLDGTLTLTVQVIAGDPTLANDLNPADNFIQTTVTFHEANTLTVHAFPLHLGEDGTSSGTPLAIHTASDGWLEQAMAFYRLWPLGKFVFDPFNPTVGNAGSGWDMSTEDGGGEPFAALAAVHAANGYGPMELSMGMVSPDADVYWGGFAQTPGSVSWSKMRSGYSGAYPWHHRAGATIAQELGHNTGLQHAPCDYTAGDPLPGELHGGPVDPLFPQSYSWPNCSIGPNDIEGFYGFDVMYQLTGTAEPSIMSNNPSISAPSNAAPFMSYMGIGKWLEPWHGCALLTWLGVPCTQTDLIPIDDDVPGQGQGLPPIGHAVPVWTCDGWNGPGNEEGDLCDLAFDQPFDPIALEDVDEELLIIATIDPDTGVADLTAGNTSPIGEVKFMYVVQADDHSAGSEDRADTPWTLYDYDGDDYLLLVRDESGRVIGMQTLDVHSANGHGDAAADPGAVEPGNPLLDDRHEHGVATLAVRIPALAGATSIEIVTENGVLAELRPGPQAPVVEAFTTEVDGDVARLSWTAIDPEGDELALLVQYRAGGEWRTVGQPIGDSIEVSLDMLPGGGDGEFRLMAGDGLHQTIVVGEPITLPDHTPFAAIVSPIDGFVRPAGRSLDLRGSGIDLEDGDGVAFAWTSDLDGSLGTGDIVSVNTLREGRHTLTLSVTDSAGNTGTHSITVEIGPSDLAASEVRAAVERSFRDGPPPPRERGGGTPWTAFGIGAAALAAAGAALWFMRRRIEVAG